uniref:Uncharacterized protein n=1 Tax=Megaselia scalaris TaxID=36166 RepID=T1GZR4_MEGSC
MSPHKALFGHDKICHGSSYELLKKLDCLNEPDFKVYSDPDKIKKIQNSIMDKIRMAHERNEKRYNLRVRKPLWKIGQVVFRRLFPQSSMIKNFNANVTSPLPCEYKTLLRVTNINKYFSIKMLL